MREPPPGHSGLGSTKQIVPSRLAASRQFKYSFMTVVLRTLLIPLFLALVLPALAQDKTGVTQDMGKPGDSTEPPKPKASPIGVVQEVPLPRAGGVLVFGGTRGVGLEA